MDENKAYEKLTQDLQKRLKERESWTCPDCCKNPCVCEILPKREAGLFAISDECRITRRCKLTALDGVMGKPEIEDESHP